MRRSCITDNNPYPPYLQRGAFFMSTAALEAIILFEKMASASNKTKAVNYYIDSF